MVDPNSVVIGGVVAAVLIVGLIQWFKRLLPGAPGNAWLIASMLLGILAQVLSSVSADGVPGTLAGWLQLVVLGLAFGLATSKLYDETLGKAAQ